MSADDVREILGRYVSASNEKDDFEPQATTHVMYHYPPQEDWTYADRLFIGYGTGGVVYVLAERMYPDRVFDRASGENPLLAYRLSAEDGQERREIGPEFTHVFKCENPPPNQ